MAKRRRKIDQAPGLLPPPDSRLPEPPASPRGKRQRSTTITAAESCPPPAPEPIASATASQAAALIDDDLKENAGRDGWEAINDNPKPYLSPSQLDMYCKCPEQYRRRYIERDKMPPGIAAHRGTGVHAGAKGNFRQKRETHRDLSPKDIIDQSVAAFDEAVERKGFQLTKDEIARGPAAVIAEQRDATARLARFHAEVQAPDYQPAITEQKVRIVLPNAPYDLLGIVDLQDDRGRVTDFKTAKRKKSQKDVDDSVQLTIYAAAAAVRGTPASEVALDTLVNNKTPTRQRLVSPRDENDYRALASRTNAVIAAITAGSFPPTMPGSWWCSPDWCGYWSTCPYVNSERKLLAIEETP